MKKSNLIEINELFFKIINTYNEIERKPYSYGTDILLHPSEVHTIEAIYINKNINITKLAKIQGITKGAVSKMVKKLVEKNLVEKNISPDTENEVILNLTKDGEKVYTGHKQYSDKLNKKLFNLYATLSEDMIDKIKELGIETEKIFLEIIDERN